MSESDRATVTVPEAARILGIGRASAYEAVRAGTIPSLRVTPRKIVVPRAALERLLASAGEPK
jgi:excisionase family DNA binding protein